MTKWNWFFVSAKENPQVASYIAALKQWRKSQYVTYRDDGHRTVRRWEAKRPSRIFSTQKEALKYAKWVAKNNGADVFVYSRSGDIRRA